MARRDRERPRRQGQRSVRRRWLWIVGVLFVGVAVVAVGLLSARSIGRARALARLPQLPDLVRAPEPLRAHLTTADRAAREPGASVHEVGALCIAYHADLVFDQAEQCYAIVAGLDSGDSGAWRWTYYRALVQGARGDTTAFATMLDDVTRQAPDFGPAWWQLGDAEFKAGHRERARAAWQRAVTLPEPERPAAPAGTPAPVRVGSIAAYATLGLARLSLAEGHADAARALLEPLTASSPRFGPAFRLLGSAYAALDRPDDASRLVRQADRLPAYDPYVDPFYDRLAHESRSSTFLLQQASAADVTTNGRWREFLIRRAIEVDPDNKDAPVELAALLRAERRYDEALEVLQRYRRDVPGDYQALADIGRCLSGLQRYTEAEGVLRRALEGLDDANTRYDLGLVLDRTGRVPDAMAEYERALARNPNHRDALNNLAVDLARLNRTAEAVGRLQQLLAIEPDNADARVNLGLLFMAQHRHAQAETEFRTVLSIDPQNARAAQGLRAAEGLRTSGR